MQYILAIDQGTSSTRSLLFDAAMEIVAQAQEEIPQIYPAPGLVEHDPEVIWATVLSTLRRASQGVAPGTIAGIGLTNQRETTVLWDRETGRPLHNAIVWQDRRTAPLCAQMKAAGYEDLIVSRTGLLLDPYFSGTKLKWLLDTVPGARGRAQAGELAFGTIDSFLIWRLTQGRVHATDATNAARTMLYDISVGCWDQDICALLGIPMGILPEVRDSAADFGLTAPEIMGQPVPIRGVAGDQQAAALGQACFAPGMAKATYGTGCFVLLNTGAQRVTSRNRLLTTIACRLDGQVSYALEGSIFVAGAVVQWLRDGPGLIGQAREAGTLAARADPDQSVIMVPAFTGLGAPYWVPQCQGAIYGLTRGTGRAELARAALESVGYQTRDLLEAMWVDQAGQGAHAALRVDGGMSGSDLTMQFLADITDVPVDRPEVQETTVLGAAWLAGLQAGLYPEPAQFAERWRLQHRFTPQMPAPKRGALYQRWKRAVHSTIQVSEGEW